MQEVCTEKISKVAFFLFQLKNSHKIKISHIVNIIRGGILALQNQCSAGVEQAPFQAFPLRSREQSELILSAALLSSLTLFHVQLRGKCPHSEAKAPIIIENLGSICVQAKPGPKLGPFEFLEASDCTIVPH